MGDHHGVEALTRAAMAMEAAVDAVLADPASRTHDIGGTISCQAFAARVAAMVGAGA